MAHRLTELGMAMSASSLSRLETEGVRDGAVVSGYEQVLGIEEGRLRGVVDAICRTFGYAPPDRAPFPPALGLVEFSALVDTVSGPESTGGEWLRFACQHQRPQGFGLTLGEMTPLVHKLASELNRSYGHAHVSRYEALAILRCSPYADLVEEVARARAMAPDTQVVLDLASVVSELPTPRLLVWAGQLLNHDSLALVRGGEIMVQNMRSVGGLADEDWSLLEQPLLSAFQRDPADRARQALLTQLFRTLPPSLRSALRPRLAGQLTAAPVTPNWSKTRNNLDHETARRLASASAAIVGLPEEPMLQRLFFEALFDFRGPHISTACLMLRASPFAVGVSESLLDLATADTADPDDRASARSRVAMVGIPTERSDLDEWLASTDPWFVRTAYLLAGERGHLLSDAQLAAGLAGDPDDQELVLRAAGLAGDPRLTEVSLDARRSPDVRAAAAYWLREGGLVTR